MLTSLAVASAVAMPITFFIPLQIHTANTYDFDASITALVPDLLLAALVIIVALSLLLVAVRGIWHTRLVSAMTGLAIAIWAQGQILVWNYGVLDGSVPDWGDFSLAAATDTLAWVLIAVATVVFRKQLFRLALPIATVLIVIQALPAALELNDPQPVPGFHQYSFDETHKFSFSRQDNVIVLLLDAYQSDIFQEILLNEPEIKEEFQGFTYFRNALAGYAKTYPTVALMLTGRWYENKIPIQEFIKQSFSKRSLPAELRERGWRVDLFPHVKRVVDVSPELASNIKPAFDCATIRSESGQLLDLGFFRASPHWLKPFWLSGYDWRFARLLPKFCGIQKALGLQAESAAEPASDSPHAAVRFVEDSETLIDNKIAEPAFKFYHLMIPHAPYSLAEDLSIAQLPKGPEGFVRQSRSALEVTKRFIDSLKEAGVYDRAMILVLSDHGGGEYIDHVKTELIETEVGSIGSDTGRIPGKHLASGLPLVLIKRPGEDGDLKVSDSPVSLGDIAPTIAAFTSLLAL